MISLVIFPVLILIYINVWFGIFWREIWQKPEWDIGFKEKIAIIQFTGFVAAVVNYLISNACLWLWAYGY